MSLSVSQIEYRLGAARRAMVRAGETGDRRGFASWRERAAKLEAQLAVATEERDRPTPDPRAEVVNEIARDKLGLITLELVNSDRVDFVELSRDDIRLALEAAYDAGRGSRK